MKAFINGKHTPAGVPFYSMIEMSVASGLPIYKGGSADVVFNWGGSGFGTPRGIIVLNESPIFGKYRQASIMYNKGLAIPRPYNDLSDVKKFPVVKKPNDSYGGHGIMIVRRYDSSLNDRDCWFQDLVDKKAEYRIYFFDGHISRIEEKIPLDRSKLVWGSAENTFDWEHRPDLEKRSKVFSEVLRGAESVRIDWGAADVLKDSTGKIWICEINSRPTCWGGKRPKLRYTKDKNNIYYADSEPDPVAAMWAEQMHRFLRDHA